MAEGKKIIDLPETLDFPSGSFLEVSRNDNGGFTSHKIGKDVLKSELSEEYVKISTPVVSALVNTEVRFGEFDFRYTSNLPNGRIEIRTLDGDPLAYHFFSYKRKQSSPFIEYSSAGMFSVNANSNYSQINTSTMSSNEHLSIQLSTLTNFYTIDLRNITSGSNEVIQLVIKKVF